MIDRHHVTDIPTIRAIVDTAGMYRHDFDPVQRRAFVAGMALTLGRPLLRVAVNYPEKMSPWRRVALNALVDLTDGVDGKITRRFGVCTPGGAVLDPLADKVDGGVREALAVRRGTLSPADFVTRMGRDAVSTLAREYRGYQDYQTGAAEPETKADIWGKASTALRMAVDTAEPILPDGRAKTTLQRLTTATLVATGVHNVRRYIHRK